MSTGLHAKLATGLTVAESEERFTRTESVARLSRQGWAAYEAEREALLLIFFSFVTGVRCSNQTERYCMRGRVFCFFFSKVSVSFFIFLRCCCAVLCFLFLTYSNHIKKEYSTLPEVCTYVRYVSERMWRPSCSYVASELFFPRAWLRDSWHYQVASLQLQSSETIFNHGPLSASHNLMDFFPS